MDIKRTSRVLLSLAGAVLLAGCLLVPGKFASSLDLRKDGSFTFVYNGELHLLAHADLSKFDKSAGAAASFTPYCYDDESGEDRECTEEEKAEQKAAWEDGEAARKEREEREMRQMQAMLGGKDPTDPNAGKQFAERLRRQRGWDKVEYAGDGQFNVEYRVTGTMDHDFVFPTIEGIPLTNPFVVAFNRDDRTVRLDAPGFAIDQSRNAMGGGTMGMLGLAMYMEDDLTGDKLPLFFRGMKGTFTITTDGEILANNTDEGPVDVANGKRIAWEVDANRRNAPMALIKLR